MAIEIVSDGVDEAVAVVDERDLTGLSRSDWQALGVVIAAMLLGFVTAEAVKAAAGPDVVIDGLGVPQYLTCLDYWKTRQIF